MLVTRGDNVDFFQNKTRKTLKCVVEWGTEFKLFLTTVYFEGSFCADFEEVKKDGEAVTGWKAPIVPWLKGKIYGSNQCCALVPRPRPGHRCTRNAVEGKLLCRQHMTNMYAHNKITLYQDDPPMLVAKERHR